MGASPDGGRMNQITFTMSDTTAALSQLGVLYAIWFIVFMAAIFYVVDKFIHRDG